MIPNTIPFPLRSSSYLWCARIRQYSSFQFPVQQRAPPACEPIVSIENSSVYRLGASSSTSAPLLHEFRLLIKEGESWAVVGTGAGKDALLQSLLGHTRIHPPPPLPGGLFPFLSLREPPGDPFTAVSLVSFSHRPKFSTGFYDYSARYGAVRDQDKLTLRQTLFPELQAEIRKAELNLDLPDDIPRDENQIRLLEYLVERLDLAGLLDLPLIALSNGQTRKARIVKALIGSSGVTPELVILDEGLTGLDASTRTCILQLLREVHVHRSPRIILGSRVQDGVSEWISNVAFVDSAQPGEPWSVQTGTREEIMEVMERYLPSASSPTFVTKPHVREGGKVLVDMKNVCVSYHGRDVLKSTNWTIRAGDRWHLQGSNGSGKTTMLSLLTGDHPQSYTQRAPSSLTLFERPRSKWATVQLRKEIGIAGVDVLNAWPRGRKMSVRDVIGTGFDGGFVPMGRMKVGSDLDTTEEQYRVKRVWEVLNDWWRHSRQESQVREFSHKIFADLPVGEQAVVILLRAVVGKPKLVLLDEAWSGMDRDTVSAVHEYLRSDALTGEQACIVVTHWEDEVPWNVADGVKKYILREGLGTQVD